jgi:hypothetical protein
VSDLSPEARAILDAGRDADGASDLERARVRRALFATIAAGGGALAGSTAAAAQSAGASATATGAATTVATALPLAKILVPLAIVAAGSVGGTIAWHARGAATTVVASSSVSTAPAPTPMAAPTVAPPAPAPVVSERPAVAPRHALARATTPVHDVAPLATNRLAEETALLAAANAALRAGDSPRALALLDDYDRRYPSGILREEVLATRLIARCRVEGDGASGLKVGARAKADADQFLARHPASPLAPRVRSSCDR